MQVRCSQFGLCQGLMPYALLGAVSFGFLLAWMILYPYSYLQRRPGINLKHF